MTEKAGKCLSSKFPYVKRLTGRGSYTAAYKATLTKLKNKTCNGFTYKTIRNGFISQMWDNLFSDFFSEVVETVI